MRRKVLGVQSASLGVRLVVDILLIHTKDDGVADRCKVFQLFFGDCPEIKTPVTMGETIMKCEWIIN